MTLNKLGTETGELRYSAWGETRYSNGTIVTDRQYTGQINDGDTGLYYYNARYYDPALHRFIQADTIVPDPSNPQSLNRFAYVRNNPIRYNDPTGHCEGDPNDPDNPDADCWLLLNDLNTQYDGIFQIDSGWLHNELLLLQEALQMLLDSFNGDKNSLQMEVSTRYYRGYTFSDELELNREVPPSCSPSCAGVYNPHSHSITMSSSISEYGSYCGDCAIFLILHEIGHAVGQNLGKDNDYLTFASDVGYSCILIFCGSTPAGYVTDPLHYATSNYNEDFAHTFAWGVFESTKGFDTSGIATIWGYGAPNDARRKAIAKVIPALQVSECSITLTLGLKKET